MTLNTHILTRSRPGEEAVMAKNAAIYAVEELKRYRGLQEDHAFDSLEYLINSLEGIEESTL